MRVSTHLSNIEGMEMAGKLPEVRLANTPFKVVSPFEPSGDQPEAIAALAKGVEDGLRYQTLLGVTGSGKTFTMAKTIEAVQKPTLVMAPNKTLAAQLAAELKEFFPDNAVVYFVSYYDYYQPEAYVPSSDTFIEKDASINEEVEKLRHAATSALLSRRDCIVVASVSCIYGIGSPMDYAGMAVFVDKQKEMDRDEVIHELIDIQYDRNDYEQKRGTFRVRGDALDVFPPYADHLVRIEFWGDEIESIDEIDHLSQQDANISQLVEMVQMQMGKALTRTEIETLVSFYTYAGLPPEYILLAVSFCCAKNMPNMRALSRLLTDMMSENIYTYEQAEEYLTRRQRQDSAQGQVKTAFGIHDRQLTRQECKYIDTWFLDYRFDISMVKLAYERTVDQIGKVSFAYINKILTSWHEKGITNTKDAANERQGMKAMQKSEQSSIDFDELQRYVTYGGSREPQR